MYQGGMEMHSPKERYKGKAFYYLSNQGNGICSLSILKLVTK